MTVYCIDCGIDIPNAARQRRRCDSCRRDRMKSYQTPRRTLRTDEEPPEGVTPYRWIASTGYVMLAWRTPTEVVQTYEHRYIARPGEGCHVHHIDGDKTNNDPSNLKVMTSDDHNHHHSSSRQRVGPRPSRKRVGPRTIAEGRPSRASTNNPRRRIDIAEATRLYESGMGTVRIGKQMGFDPAAIYRALKRSGIEVRQGFGGPQPKQG